MSGETQEKTLIELAPSAEEKIEVVTKTTNATLAWVEKIHKFITKNGLKKLVFDLLVVGMVVFMGLFFVQPGIFVNRFEKNIRVFPKIESGSAKANAKRRIFAQEKRRQTRLGSFGYVTFQNICALCARKRPQDLLSPAFRIRGNIFLSGSPPTPRRQ